METVALVYAGTREEALGSLGFQRVLLELREGFNVEVFTLDSPVSWNGKPLGSVDLVLISSHFENRTVEALGYIYSQGYEGPVGAGGPGVWNPLPFLPFVDAFFLGEADGRVVEFAERVISGEKGWTEWTRSELNDYAVEQVKGRGVFGEDAYLLEVSRGCTSGCRFCMIGWAQRPTVFRPLSQIRSMLDYAWSQGFKRVVFISSDVFHPRLMDILDMVEERGMGVSFPSLRADKITEEFVERIASMGVKSMTIAPEQGSWEERKRLSKKIRDERIMEVVEWARKYGMKHVKLYFIIGLGENPENMVALVKRVRRVIPVKVSVSIFVPKPFTPYAFLGMEKVEVLREKNRYLKKRLGKIHTVNPKRAYVQTALSKGDEKVGEALARIRGLTYALWKKYPGMDGIVYGKYWPKVMELVDTGVKRSFLESEMEKTEPTPSCEESCSLCRRDRGLCEKMFIYLGNPN